MASVSQEKTRWMRGPSTPLRGALLGLLLERPGHGGDLANRLAARLGETWRVDTNDVYRLLEQLENTGLAVSRDEPEARQPAPHAISSTTRRQQTSEALTLWMETLLPREPVRLGLQAKLSVAREQDAPRLLDRAARPTSASAWCSPRSSAPPTARPTPGRPLCMDCSRDAVYAQLQTEVDWAARTTAADQRVRRRPRSMAGHASRWRR